MPVRTLIVTDKNKLNFAPATEIEEIYQNIATILKTIRGSVPLDRDFGVDWSPVDMPEPVAMNRYRAEVIDAIERDEPRARVLSIDFVNTKDGVVDGILSPKITVEIVTND